jgi:hypothetical protein
MGNVIEKQYRETPENKLALGYLEKKVILSLGGNFKIKGSPNSFFIYESDSLFGYVNMSGIIAVKDRDNKKRASELAYKLDPTKDWTLEESYLV